MQEGSGSYRPAHLLMQLLLCVFCSHTFSLTGTCFGVVFMSFPLLVHVLGDVYRLHTLSVTSFDN